MKFVYSKDQSVRFLVEKENNEVTNFTYQPERLNPEDHFDDFLKDSGKYYRRMEDNLIKEMICDSPNTTNK